jgi:hypothetical protein
MILADHFGQAFGPQPVRQGARRIISQVAGFKQVGHARN